MAFDLMDLVGLGGVKGLELIFGICALVGAFLFLLWFVMMMIGGALSDVVDGVSGGDFSLGDADLSFKALTFQGISAFLMMFGLVGLAVFRTSDYQALSVIAGGGAGGASMWGVAKMFDWFKSFETSGNVDIGNAVGSTGEVYVKIPANGRGQVQVTFQGALRTHDALSTTGAALSTGSLIRVKEIAGSMLIVEPLRPDSEE